MLDVTAMLNGPAGTVLGLHRVTLLPQVPLWGGGELSSSEVVVDNHEGKCFHAQPALRP